MGNEHERLRIEISLIKCSFTSEKWGEKESPQEFLAAAAVTSCSIRSGQEVKAFLTPG